MGLMAFYCGFIYNEFFAITTDLFGSCYQMNKPESVEFQSVQQLGDGSL